MKLETEHHGPNTNVILFSFHFLHALLVLNIKKFFSWEKKPDTRLTEY